MIYIAKDFFEKHYFTIKTIEEFQDTDLSFYFQMAYKANLELQDQGIIKLIKRGDLLIGYEHMFFDFARSHGHMGDEVVGYLNIPDLKLGGTEIANSLAGYNLSTKGHHVIEFSDKEQDIMRKYPQMNFIPTGDTSMMDPYATFKYNTAIWNNTPKITNQDEQHVYDGIRNIYSDFFHGNQVLSSLDSYDLNILQWLKGRAMTPHNGVDYRSMINMISYNTDHCSETRSIMAGEFDWYDVTMSCAFREDWEDLIDIKQIRKQTIDLPVTTKKALVVNVFNPRYYHQVGEFKGEGELYVCTSNMSFKAITEKFKFKW